MHACRGEEEDLLATVAAKYHQRLKNPCTVYFPLLT
eukprot:COSAG02_NODE_40399_length_406_cov_0.615635_1_plen_35_part_01